MLNFPFLTFHFQFNCPFSIFTECLLTDMATVLLFFFMILAFSPIFLIFLHFYSLFNSQCSLIWQQCHFSFPPPTVLSCCPDCGSQYLSISQSRYNSVCNFGEFLLKMFKGINGIKAKVTFLSFFFPFLGTFPILNLFQLCKILSKLNSS